MPLSKARQAYKNRYPHVLQNILVEILDPHEKRQILSISPYLPAIALKFNN